MTADGARAVAWEDSLPAAPYDGRLHLAVEGAAPLPSVPPPAVRVLPPDPARAAADTELLLPVRCAGPCDLRVTVAGRVGVVAQASLAHAGTAHLRLTPQTKPLAPATPGPVRFHVVATAPAAAVARRITATFTLRQLAPPPLPRLLGLTAVRHGDNVDVRWHTDVPARQVMFTTVVSRTPHGGRESYGEQDGDGQRSFHFVMHDDRARQLPDADGRADPRRRQAPRHRPDQWPLARLSCMPSSTLATVSHASTADSSVSKMSFQRITIIGSIPALKRSAMAARCSRSASFSSRWISTSCGRDVEPVAQPAQRGRDLLGGGDQHGRDRL